MYTSLISALDGAADGDNDIVRETIASSSHVGSQIACNGVFGADTAAFSREKGYFLAVWAVKTATEAF
ncbi:MAG: hypothetical protein IJU21_01790 [Bacteroidales bacterium]|nr:hypothetical protein [Bacteroidales bacterium]